MNKITQDETEHGVEYVRADEAQAEVLEQCRIIAMGAEREDALRAELTRLKASIALDKMAKNARELGLNYDTPLSAFVRSSDEDKAEVMERVIDKAIEAQKEKIGCVNHDCDQCKAVQEPLGYIASMAANDLRASIYRDVTVYGEDLEDTVAIYTTPPAQPAPVQEPVAWVNHGENRITRATGWDGYGALYTTPPAPQPVPVKTYHDGKPWPVAPKPWVGLTDAEIDLFINGRGDADDDNYVEPTGDGFGLTDADLLTLVRRAEAKLKELNHV
jgi:hypothetical protein